MSKASWGAAVSLFFGLIGIVAPIPDRFKLPITIVAAIGLLISCTGWVFAYTHESPAGVAQFSPDALQSTTKLPSQIWDETVGLWREATQLIKQWATNGKRVRPLVITKEWITRFELFARNNLSLEQLKIVFNPLEDLNFRGGLPSAIKPTPEILDAWQKLSAYEMHLQAFMRDELRRPSSTPMPTLAHIAQLQALPNKPKQRELSQSQATMASDTNTAQRSEGATNCDGRRSDCWTKSGLKIYNAEIAN